VETEAVVQPGPAPGSVATSSKGPILCAVERGAAAALPHELAPADSARCSNGGMSVKPPPERLERAERGSSTLSSGSDAQVLHGSRRGEPSLRQRTLVAYETLEFPPYPAHAVCCADFELPRHMIDSEAPLSARQWDLATSLSSSLDSLRGDREQALLALKLRKQAASDEVESKRTRRPTAIMRQNVEVARLMGMPGTKQKHMQVSDLEEEPEQPQHLCTQRPRERELKPPQPAQPSKAPAQNVGGRAHPMGKLQPNGKHQLAPNRLHASPRAASATGPMIADAAESSSGPLLEAAAAVSSASDSAATAATVGSGRSRRAESLPQQLAQPPRAASAGHRTSLLSPGSGEISSGSVRGRRADPMIPLPRAALASAVASAGSATCRPLPVVTSTPSALMDAPTTISGVPVVSVLPPGAPLPQHMSTLASRQVTGTLLRQELGKRRRRPPNWLVEQETFDGDDGTEDGAEQAGPRRKRAASISSVEASLSHPAGKGAGSAASGGSCGTRRVSVFLHGVLPSSCGTAQQRTRAPSAASMAVTSALMPPPIATSSSASPRLKGQSTPHSAHASSRKSLSSQKQDAIDAFQIHFGDLPSPRMIEVVRPKEVVLPGWRIIGSGPDRAGSALKPAPRASEASSSASTRPPPQRAAVVPKPLSSLPLAAAAHAPASACDTAVTPSAATKAASSVSDEAAGPTSAERSTGADKPASSQSVALPPPCLANGGAAVVSLAVEGESESDESEGDDTADAMYEQRHTRTLERAIAAARAVSRAMALQERMRTNGCGDSPKAEPTLEEEWRFRPSELAALCAAATMSFPSNGASAGGGAKPASSTAGFFGLGGANRGADTNDGSNATGEPNGDAGCQATNGTGSRGAAVDAAGGASGQRGESDGSGCATAAGNEAGSRDASAVGMGASKEGWPAASAQGVSPVDAAAIGEAAAAFAEDDGDFAPSSADCDESPLAEESPCGDESPSGPTYKSMQDDADCARSSSLDCSEGAFACDENGLGREDSLGGDEALLDADETMLVDEHLFGSGKPELDAHSSLPSADGSGDGSELASVEHSEDEDALVAHLPNGAEVASCASSAV